MNTLTPLLPGVVECLTLSLEAPISFWGGVDMETGRIIDRSHPQQGRLIGGLCLIVPMIRGSGGTPGNLAMTLKLGVGPAAIVIGYPDINVMAGLVVAHHLYDTRCPLFLATEKQQQSLKTISAVAIEENGAFRPSACGM